MIHCTPQPRDVYRKPLGERSVSAAVFVVKLTRLLIAAGVRTPQVTYEPRSHQLIFSAVAGYEARTLVGLAIRHGYSTNALWQSLLSSLIILHGIKDLSGLTNVNVLNPIARRLYLNPIARRLYLNPIGSQCTDIELLFARLRQTEISIRNQLDISVIHGDCHVGQFILRSQHSNSVIVDLDDCGLGPREFDIANLAVHAATSLLKPRLPHTFDKPDGQYVYADLSIKLFRQLSDYLGNCYTRLGGKTLSNKGLTLYGSVGFMRRSLKHIENRRDHLEAAGWLRASELLLSSCQHSDRRIV